MPFARFIIGSSFSVRLLRSECRQQVANATRRTSLRVMRARPKPELPAATGPARCLATCPRVRRSTGAIASNAQTNPIARPQAQHQDVFCNHHHREVRRVIPHRAQQGQFSASFEDIAQQHRRHAQACRAQDLNRRAAETSIGTCFRRDENSRAVLRLIARRSRNLTDDLRALLPLRIRSAECRAER